MKTLNQFFDHIYCINLDRRPDRWEECLREFDRVGLTDVERFSACDGNVMGWDSPLLPGELGIIQSHVKLAEDAIRNGYQNVLILEDDVEFSLTFSIDFMMWQEEVPDDWQMLYLGANLAGWNPNKGVHSEHVVNGYHLFAAHALGLRLNVLEDVYFSHYQDKAIDVWYAENSVYHKPYLFIPRMAWQRASYSDIQNEDVSYGFLRRGQWGVDS